MTIPATQMITDLAISEKHHKAAATTSMNLVKLNPNSKLVSDEMGKVWLERMKKV